MQKKFEVSAKSLALLQEAASHWYAMAQFRRDRDRAKRYCYGDQWGDLIQVDGETITEQEHIRRQGSIPLKNNLIRRLVKNVMGIYRTAMAESPLFGETFEGAPLPPESAEMLLRNSRLNHLDEVNARSLEEFLISGLVVHRKWSGTRDGVHACWTEYVSPASFFLDTGTRDFRGWDTTMVGEVHDVSREELLNRFAADAEEYERLSRLYCIGDFSLLPEDFGKRGSLPESFLHSSHPGKYRVIEIWRKEMQTWYDCHHPELGKLVRIGEEELPQVEAENRRRHRLGLPPVKTHWRNAPRWRYYFLTPRGEMLATGDTPYSHGEHPYVFKAYPFIDGEIHSFVSDIIDQQRYTNRLITLYDWVMRASAKGVLMVPEESLGAMSPEEFADQWTRFNGVVYYRSRPGVSPPHQISSNSTNIGITELLSIQLKFFEDISGVNSSLQGKASFSGMSGSLFSQQTYNATMSLQDILSTFTHFLKDGLRKELALIN